MFVFIDDNNNRNSNNKSLFWGGVLVVAGILFLLKNINVLNFEIPDGVISWRIIFVVFAINSLLSKKWNSAVFWGGLCVILYAPILFDIQPLQFKYIWPVVIIAIGFAIMGRTKVK